MASPWSKSGSSVYSGALKHFNNTFGTKPQLSTFDGVRGGRNDVNRFNDKNIDALAKEIVKQQSKKVGNLAGTNVQDLVSTMKKLIESQARKDQEGKIINADIRIAARNIDTVAALLEKNERNEAMTDKQMIQLSHGLQQLANVQTGILKGDPRYTAEGRFMKALKAQEASLLLNNKNLKKVLDGKSTDERKQPNGALSASRHALYAMTGPFGPLLSTADDIVSGLRENKDEIVKGFKIAGESLGKASGYLGKTVKGLGSVFSRMRGLMGGSGGSGGGISDWFRGRGGKLSGRLGGIGKIAKFGGAALGIGGIALGAASEFNAGADPSQTAGDKALSYGGAAASGALTGAAIGSGFAGVGAIPGAAVGAIGSVIATFVSRNWSEMNSKIAGQWKLAKETFSTGIEGLGKVMNEGADKVSSAWDMAKGWVASNVINPGRAYAGQAKEIISGAAKSVSDGAAMVSPSAPLGPAAQGLSRIAGKLVQPSDRVKSAIMQASQETGIDPGYLMAMTRQESGFNPNAKASTSSAAGLNQFIDGTWNSMVGKYGSQYGIGKGDRMDPHKNAMMGALFAKENKASLQKTLGREPTAGELYMAHFMGSGGANQFLGAMSKDPSASAASIMPKAAAANKNIFYGKNGKAKSLQEVYKSLNDKIEPYASAYGTQIAQESERAKYGNGIAAAGAGRGNAQAQLAAQQQNTSKQTSVQDIPIIVDDLGLILANTSALG